MTMNFLNYLVFLNIAKAVVFFYYWFEVGEVSSVGQSTCFTRRGSGVRVPHLPPESYLYCERYCFRGKFVLK